MHRFATARETHIDMYTGTQWETTSDRQATDRQRQEKAGQSNKQTHQQTDRLEARQTDRPYFVVDVSGIDNKNIADNHIVP